MTEETPKIPAIEAKSQTRRVETGNIKNKTLINELQWVKSMKVKLLKMTEETQNIPAIEAKSQTRRVETSNIKSKTLVNEL